VSTLVADIGLLASQNLFLAYFIIYIATIFLGNISAFASFWIVFQGYFGMWGVPFLILTIFLADVTGDLLWYALGRATRDTRHEVRALDQAPPAIMARESRKGI